MTVETPPQLITIEQAAALMSIGRTKIYSLAAEGRLPGCIRVDRSLRVHRPTLERWLEEQAAHATQVAYR